MPLTKVSSGVIAANAVVDSFGTQSITGDKLGLTAINANNIVNASITGAKIALGTITGDDIATGQITGNLIATNAISQNNIVSVNASVATVGTLPTARLPSGTVLQVVSNTKTDTFSTTSASFTDITGLFVTITPISATSNILVMYTTTVGTLTGQYSVGLQLVRGATAIYLGTAASARTRASSWGFSESSAYWLASLNGIFLDSPATTSATTYKLQMISPYGVTSYLGQNQNDNDSTGYSRVPATITVMEIAG